MKRIDANTIVPAPDEIISHKDAFGVEAGEPHSTWKYFGDRRKPEENPVAICIGPIRFDHTEAKLLYSLGSGFASAAGGDRDLIMSTKPYAANGDPENVAISHYGYRKSAKALKMFVNDKNEHPSGQQFIYKYIAENGKWTMQKVPDPDQGIWLEPYVDYYLTLRRINAEFGQNNPALSIYHVGGGDETQERMLTKPVIDVTDLIGNLEAYEMDLGPLGTGIFIPD